MSNRRTFARRKNKFGVKFTPKVRRPGSVRRRAKAIARRQWVHDYVGAIDG